MNNLIVMIIPITQSCFLGLFDEKTKNPEASNGALLIEQEWETLITPAPTIVWLLAQLMSVLSQKDFSLVNATPIGGFKHITNPESYRATTIQLSSLVARAFIGAQENMQTVSLSMEQVPGRLRQALQVVDLENKTTAAKWMPVAISRVISLIEKSQATVQRNSNAFHDVSCLLGELTQTTVARDTKQKEELDEVVQRRRDTANRVEFQRKELKKMQDLLKKIAAEVRKRQAAYDRAVDDIPTGAEAAFLSIGQFFVNIFSNIASIFTGNGLAGWKEVGDEERYDLCFQFFMFFVLCLYTAATNMNWYGKQLRRNVAGKLLIN